MVRKAIIQQAREIPSQWMDLAAITRLEITSEDPEHPIEYALSPDSRFWRAAEDGEQTIRVFFDTPQNISCISLLFEEKALSRTQEFSLSWQQNGKPSVELVRQQYNFSPPNTTQEHEEYKFSLAQVSALELIIIPDVGKPARASLTHLLVR